MIVNAPRAVAPALHFGAPLPQAAAFDTIELRCFTVVVDGHAFGLPVEGIQTIFEMMAVTPVPLAPYEVLGLVNLRGKIATALSLRRRLRRGACVAEPSNLAVGIEHRGETFALVVDEVGDVITLDRTSEIEIPPHLGAEGLKFSSVHRLEAQILPVLDLGWILTLDPDHQFAAG